MVEFFDSGFEQPQAAAPKVEFEVLSEGEHDLEIVAASVGDVSWKASDANPTGACLKLRLSAGRGFKFLFADLPRDRAVLFRALASALGLEPGADGKVSIGPPEQLIGRRVRALTGRYTTRAGETRANVVRWLPATSAAPPATKPAPARCRTPSTKAAAEFRATASEEAFPF